MDTPTQRERQTSGNNFPAAETIARPGGWLSTQALTGGLKCINYNSGFAANPPIILYSFQIPPVLKEVFYYNLPIKPK